MRFVMVFVLGEIYFGALLAGLAYPHPTLNTVPIGIESVAIWPFLLGVQIVETANRDADARRSQPPDAH